MTRLLLAGSALLALATTACAQPVQPEIVARVKPLLQVDGLSFRDSNASGTLDPYEDWRLPAEARAADLVSRMTLAE